MPKAPNNVDMSSEATRSVRNVEIFENEIANYVNAAVGLIMIRTREPVRCAEWLNRIAIKREAKFKLWACNRGWQHAEREPTQREGEEIRIDILSLKGDMSTVDLSTAFKSIFDEHQQRRNNSLMGSDSNPQSDYYALFYPHHHFDKPLIHAWIKDFGQLSREADKRMFLIVPDTVRVPSEIEDDMYIMDFMVPSFAELHDGYTAFIKTLPDGARPDHFTDEEVSRIVQNGLGMTHLEFETAVALAVVTYEGPGKDKSKADDYVKLMLNHKIEVIKKTDLLELMPPEDMANVGGFDTMKEWLELQSTAFSEEAKAYGIEKPKGILCVGPPGTGKSLFSKATANKFGVPLVKFDIGKVFGKFVGESEGRVRQAIKIIEAMAPCVLLVDEIDKGFGGLSGGGTDGGTSMRVLGSFLNWMQDRDVEKYPVFIVMTANNVQGLPPELMRRGRIDEIFACTFPGAQERRDIAKIHLKKRGHNLPVAELNKIAEACPEYVGAEIEAAVKGALLVAYNEGAERPTADHVIKHLQEMVPLSKAFADKMRLMNEWAANNAKPASSSMVFDGEAANGGTNVKPRPSRSINIPGKGGIKSRSLDN